MLNARSTPSATLATLLYAVAAVGMTWPLAAGLTRDIPWDLGDSVLNCWILQWGADHWLRFLGGDLRAFSGFFNANIFYPEPLALAYSEHLMAQVLQVLPVYALTGNVVLCYNLLFLSTFVLSGLGAFLLVRELTGSSRAAFVAGLFYAFAPYRIGQFSHLQVLSSQWMPFALFGLRRYFETRHFWPLAGAAGALVAQNLSCGYFLFYFAPFVAAYVLYEVADRGLWRDVRLWGSLAAAAAAVTAVTVPFLLPYAELRARGFGPRPLEEVVRFSADVYSYLTAHEAQHAWGWLVRAFQKPEGELFPSVTPVLLALIGVISHARHLWTRTASQLVPGVRSPRESAHSTDITPGVASHAGSSQPTGIAPGEISQPRAARTSPGDIERPDRRGRRAIWGGWVRWRRIAIFGAAVALASQLAAVVIILARNGLNIAMGPLALRMHDMARALQMAAMAAAVLAILSPRVRALVRGVPKSALAFYGAALLIAFWLSLGPVIYTQGQRVDGDGPYWWLYLYIPGFDGLRVPARFGMLVALFLAVLGGYGAAVVERAWPRRGPALVLAAGLVFLFEATPAPVELNGTWQVEGLVPPPVPLISSNGPPAIYRAVGGLPATAALAEFPFGEDQFDLRYMVWSAEHGRPLLNGYSGGFPRSFVVNRAALMRVLDAPEQAWAFLSKSGATHALVHEGIYLHDEGARVRGWLLAHGARQVAASGDDRLFELPPPS